MKRVITREHFDIKDSLLEDGYIPPYTDCPFREQCEIATHGFCLQDKDNYFSCAAARGFDMVYRYSEKLK